MRHPRIIIASDRPDQVTGQGFQNFFVATPGLVPIAASSTSAGTVPASPLSVSVPLAGPELGTAFTFRRFTRQVADAREQAATREEKT